MTETLGQKLRTLLAARGWTQTDLVRASGVDKNTLSGLINGKSQPRAATLGRLEAALGLSPGDLAGPGEDRPFRLGHSALDGPDRLQVELANAADAEVTSELSYRLESLRRQVAEMASLIESNREAVERERRRNGRRKEFLGHIDEDSPEGLQRILQEVTNLVFESQEGAGSWKVDHQAAWEALCDTVDALAWAEDNDLVVVERLAGPDEGPGGLPEGDYLGLTEGEPHPQGVVQLPEWFWRELIRRNERPYTGPRPGEDPWQKSDASAPRGGTNIAKLTPKHQRMIEDAQPMETAAYDGKAPEEDT